MHIINLQCFVVGLVIVDVNKYLIPSGLPAFPQINGTIHLPFSDYFFKVLLTGDLGVGKSCLMLRLAVSPDHIVYVH